MPKCSVLVDPVLDLKLDQAFSCLRTLVGFAEAELRRPSRDNRVETTSVILWMRVFQQLNPEVSLEAAMKSLIENPPDYLPEHVRSPAKLGVAVTVGRVERPIRAD